MNESISVLFYKRVRFCLGPALLFTDSLGQSVGKDEIPSGFKVLGPFEDGFDLFSAYRHTVGIYVHMDDSGKADIKIPKLVVTLEEAIFEAQKNYPPEITLNY